MIHTLASDRSDQPFGKAILPRRRRRGGLVPDAHGAQSAFDDSTIDPIPIADEVAWRPILVAARGSEGLLAARVRHVSALKKPRPPCYARSRHGEMIWHQTYGFPPEIYV